MNELLEQLAKKFEKKIADQLQKRINKINQPNIKGKVFKEFSQVFFIKVAEGIVDEIDNKNGQTTTECNFQKNLKRNFSFFF